MFYCSAQPEVGRLKLTFKPGEEVSGRGQAVGIAHATRTQQRDIPIFSARFKGKFEQLANDLSRHPLPPCSLSSVVLMFMSLKHETFSRRPTSNNPTLDPPSATRKSLDKCRNHTLHFLPLLQSPSPFAPFHTKYLETFRSIQGP